MFRFDVCAGQHRAGLRLPVACEHIHAARHRRPGERRRQRRAADDHLQVREVNLVDSGRGEQHLKQGRHAMGERHLLLVDHLDEDFGRVSAGEHELDARQRRRVRAAPGVNVEHRRHRHVNVVAMETAVARRKAIFDEAGERMQHHLPMGEIDALRPTGCSRRVEDGRAGVLVEVRERVVGRTDRQQRLIFGLDRKVDLLRLGPVVHQDVTLHRLQMGRELLDERQEVGVEQHRRRAAVDDRVGDVLGNEADVHCLHHGAHHRNGEVAFVIAVAVPFEDRDDVALIDANLSEAAG